MDKAKITLSHSGSNGTTMHKSQQADRKPEQHRRTTDEEWIKGQGFKSNYGVSPGMNSFLILAGY
jgi:hypothetical protein